MEEAGPAVDLEEAAPPGGDVEESRENNAQSTATDADTAAAAVAAAAVASVGVGPSPRPLRRPSAGQRPVADGAALGARSHEGS